MKNSLFSKTQSVIIFFFIINSFLFSSVLGAALSGTYTIGGTSPNYSTIASAVSALTSNGVSGAVTFNIRTGTYTEHISITAISGASSTNTVTFQSETGVNTNVVLTYASSASSSTDYVLQLDGASYLRFKNMSIQSTGGSVIYIKNSACYNVFDGDIITGVTSGTYKYIVYTSSATNSQNNQFTNNTFQNGSYGFYYNGKSSSYASGLVVSNNTFSGQSSSPIDFIYVNSPTISQNIIGGTNSNNNNNGAIEIHTSSGTLQIDKNKITGMFRYGILLNNNTGTSSSYGLVANNFIQIGGSTTYSYYCYGIYVDGQTYTKFYHNSVNITTGSGSTLDVSKAALYFDNSYTTSYLNFYNNIFVNSAGGYVVYAEALPTSSVCNYNDLYTSGATLAYSVSAAKNTIADWRTASAFDANSFNVDPSYTNSTDLHAASSTLCDAGTPVSEVTTDIDGASRSTTTPDIGADEYQVLTDDAALLSFTSPTIPFAAGSQTVKVTLFNNGVNAITSATIAWTVNGVSQTNYSWSGSLASGASTTATLGNYTFNLGTAYTIVTTVSSPNGHTDTKSTNNAITSSSLYAGYSGTYEVGTSSGYTFTTLANAITALQNGGMVGAVTLSLQSQTFNEQVSIAQISGSSSTNTLTIQSKSGNNTDVTLSYTGTITSSNNYIVQLNGVDYTTIKNIKIQNTNTSYSKVIEFTNNANYNTINNCLIYGGTTGTSDNLILVYSGSSYLNENNSITNNTIQTGSVGIYFAGTSSTYSSGITITNNNISNVKSKAINVAYQNACNISQNIISGYSYTSFYGIYIANSSNGLRIEKNKITGGYGYGIYLSSVNGSSSDYALVDNNFIQIGGTSTCKGIYLSSNTYLKLYYNSINITGTSTSTSGYATPLYLNSSFANIQIKNNIFANTGGGYAIYSATTTNTSSICDYNDLYTSGSNLAYWSSANRTDLAAWRTASSLDANSVSANPTFTSSTDLHASASAISNVASAVTEVTTDIDGESRNATTPDIGADEMPLSANDAGLLAYTSPIVPFAAGSQNISVTLLNNSGSTLTSAKINWTVNGVAQTQYSWSGSITAGSSSAITIGTYSFTLGTAYSITATVSLPNGNTDINSANDAITTSNLYAGYSGTYTIGASACTFSSLTDAITKIQYGGLLGAVTLNMKSGTYNEQVSISPIPAASSTKTLTVQSETGVNTDVVISYATTSSNNYVVQLNGADYISFKNLTIQSTGTSSARVVCLTAVADNNTFDGNKLIGVQNVGSVIYCSDASTSQNNTFRNNTVQYGDYGIYYYGQNSSKAAGISISNNTIQDQNSAGICLYYVSAPVISSNIISTSSNSYSYRGIKMSLCSNGYQVQQNKISGGTGYGLDFSYANGISSSYGSIANNFIETGAYISGSNIYPAYGINLDHCDYINLYYNAVNVVASNPSTNNYALYTDHGSYQNYKNNIFKNNAGGYALYCNASGVISSSDYNDLYSSGSASVYTYLNGTAYDVISSWRTGSGFDSHSYQVNPQYTSDTDLHINQPALNAKGSTISGYTTDIDGETRNTSTPDIGADEREGFTSLTDVGVTALVSPSVANGLSETVAVKIRIENLGSTTISGSLSVGYILNGGTQVTENTGSLSLNPGDRTDYTFTNVPTGLAALKSLSVKAFTMLSSDANYANDTLTTDLEWLPDLLVTSINTASSFTLAQTIDLTWIVSNNGNGSTGSNTWYDHVWLSSDEDLRQSDDVLLTTVGNLTYLQAGQTYTQTASIAIPTGVASGNYYLFVTSDMYDAYCVGGTCYDGVDRDSHGHTNCNVVDEIYDDNNYASAQIVLTTPPSADLNVTSVAVPSSAYSGTSVTVNYTVQNKGAAAISSGSWTDYIYVSSSTTFDASTATYVASVSNAASLSVNASYSIAQSITIPNAIYGNYYVYVVANANAGVTEYTNTYSNTSTSNTMAVTLTPPANLVPQSITCAASANSGQSYSISWTVKNNGANAPYESLWNDKIYISTSSSFDASTATLIGTYYKTSGTSLSATSSYTASESYTLPNGISGNYYVYVVVDADNNVYEYTSDNDNTLKSTSTVAIALSASPDLTVTSSTVDATVYAGYTTTLSWNVKNQGTAAASSWINGIYLSSDNTIDASDVLLDTITTSTSLATNQTATLSATINLTDLTISGAYYIIVSADYNNAIYEYNGETNNSLGKAVTMSWKYADLNITSFTANATANSGGSISASWQVQNAGTGYTYKTYWYDYVYLSTNNTYDAADTKLKTSLRYGTLEASASYSQSSVSIDIPDGLSSGTYYLIFAADAIHMVTNETSTSNNYLAKAITISATTPSDVIVSSATVPTSVYAGQELTIPYTVTNQGTVATQYSSWYAGVYLSNKTDLSDYNIKLAQQKGNVILNPGASFTGSITITVPSYLSGNNYLIVMADCNDKLYEGSNEGNNLKACLTNIQVASPSDLTVTAISLPSSVILGNTASVSYTIKNNGSSTAVGALRDITYLSSNNSLDASVDQLINYNDQTISLAAGSSASYTMSGAVTGIMPGNYYGILNTNALNTISETNTSNNTLTTSSTSAVGVNALTLGTASSSNLQIDNNVYYKVDVSVNQDLMLTLTSNQTDGYNEVYVAYNRIPSTTDYDYKQSVAAINQQVLVPSTQAGSYYIMIKTISMFSSTQTVSVLAQALSFQILSIDPSTIGQGVVTCTLKGAGFRTGMQVYLKNSSNVIVATAEIREEVSSMEFRIRWSLASVALGTYNVVAVNTDLSTATLTNGLTVETATDYNISYTKYTPSEIKHGASAFYTYTIKNMANIDVPYLVGYFMIDSTVEVSEAKINGEVYQSSLINPTTGEATYWFDGSGKRFIPFHLKDLQPNEEVSIDFTFKNFEEDTFSVYFMYKAISKATKINYALAEADSMRSNIIRNVSYYSPILGGDLISFLYDQINARKFYLAYLTKINDVLPEDTVGITYTNNLSLAVILNSKLNATQALGCDFAENVEEDIDALLESVSEIPFEAMSEVTPVTGLFSDNTSDVVVSVAVIGGLVVVGYVGSEVGIAAVLAVGSVAGVGLGLYAIYQTMDGISPCDDDDHYTTSDLLDDVKDQLPSIPWPNGGDKDGKLIGYPVDPNEISGPSGLGSKQWVSINDNLNYTIYFENDSDATAPAQQIVIAQPLSSHVDPYSVTLGNFGFANMNFSVPANSITYSTTLDLVDTLGVDVNVSAGLDIVNNQVLWTFQAIDPNTGKAPIDPSKGILQPDDASGVGQGFVSYSVNPSASCNTGDSINATAEITFDVNEPVSTNMHFNVVDAHAPVTTMSALATSYTTPSFTLNWNGIDDSSNGVGIENYDVYVSHNGAAYELYSENTSATSVAFTGSSSDVSLSFYVVAMDSVSNQETKSVADISTSIGSITVTSPNGGEASCASSSRTITWSASNVSSFNLYYSTNGTSYTSIANNVSGNSYNWTLPSASGTYYVKVSNASNEAMYDVSNATFTINALPSPTITSSTGTTSFCTSATLTSSAATNYSWSTGSTASSISITASGTYTVTVTNSNGCSASTSKTMSKTSAPTANFNFTTSAKTATFSNTSTNASSYSWNFGDAATSTSTSPSHTYSAAGTYSVKLIATNSCGSNSKTRSVTVSSSKTSGIDEVSITEEEVLWLYPNPSSDIANIDVNVENEESDVEINVIDLTGKIVEKLYSGNLSNGKYAYQWNAGKYNSGIYLVMVKIDDQMYQKRLVVVKN